MRGSDPGSLTHSLSLSLPIHVSDTAATSQEGSIFRMQGTEGCVGTLQTNKQTKLTEIKTVYTDTPLWS